MLRTPMDVLSLFPIRKSKKQKAAFRDAVQSYVSGLGYNTAVEKGSLGSRNIVIGDPENASYLITAHYDTPASIGIPNVLTPCNLPVYILFQIFIVGILVASSVAVGFLTALVTRDFDVIRIAVVTFYWTILILMMAGPANKSNVNDNSSGVITLLQIAAALPEAEREKVCFVLFDLEELGLLGSAAYRKKHKKATENQIVLNLDCVGDGNEIMLFPTRKLKKDPSKMELLRSMNGTVDEKTITLHERGFSVYPSDQANFPYGVGIAAFRRSKWVGLYCDKIHTRKDTVLEEENVNILRDRLIDLIANAAQ